MSVESWAVARFMAGLGYKVFPLQDGGKRPREKSEELKTQDEKGRGGFYAGTTDLEVIDFWTKEVPHANYAIRCGEEVTVLDLDRHSPEQDGARVLDGWCKEFGSCKLYEDIMCRTFTVQTPSNGLHLYFQKFSGISRTLTSGVELQNFGRYVVGPGCWFKDKQYVGFGEPMLGDLLKGESWLVRLVSGTMGIQSGVFTSTQKMTIQACLDRYGKVPVGFRHDAVFMEIWQMFQFDGLSQWDAFCQIKNLIAEHFEGDAGFTDNELKRNIKNVLRRLDEEPERWLFDE